MTTIVKKATNAIGAGMLQVSVEYEGAKGCSPVLCTEPVGLEPPYQTFDTDYILSVAPGTSNKAEAAVSEVDLEPLVTFEIYASEDDLLTLPWMTTMHRALSVLPGRKSFEVVGNREGVWVRFAIRRSEAPGFRTAVLGHFPAVRIREVPEPFPEGLPAAVNEAVAVPPYHRTLTLIGAEGASPLGPMVVTMADLPGKDLGFFQVVYSPVSPDHDWHYNLGNLIEAEVQANRFSAFGGLTAAHSYDTVLPPLLEITAQEKVRVDVAFYATVIRFGVWSKNKKRTAAFLQGMRVTLGMLRFGNRSFRILSNDILKSTLGEHSLDQMVRNRLSHRPGLLLTSKEIASMVHLPAGRTLQMHTTIHQRTGYEWVPFDEDEVESGSSFLGINNYAGENQRVVIPMNRRLRQTYVLGMTGSGKTNELHNLALEDIRSNQGICVIDPHGDLVLDILATMPEERMIDLIFLSFSIPGWVLPWNPFKSKAPSGKVADDIARGYLAMTSSSGPRMEHIFRMLAYVIHQIGGTLDDFAEMIGHTGPGELLRHKALDVIDNPQAIRFLKTELPNFTASDVASVRNKLSTLLLDEHLGYTFRQSKNIVWPRQWMDEGKVVLVNLASGLIGADHAHFAGGLLVSLIHRAALGRATVPKNQRRPFILYADEFQNLQTGTLSDILSEGRKYGLGVAIAHQERGQLRPELAHAIGNCGTKIIFKPAADDVAYAVKTLNGQVQQKDLLNLEIGDALVGCGGRIGSLRVPLCTEPLLRDPRKIAREFAEKHYVPWESIGRQGGDTPRRRPRFHDSLATKKGETDGS